LSEMGRAAPLSLLFAALIAIASYVLSYRRCLFRLPELEGMKAGRVGVRGNWMFRLLDRLILRTPVQRAGYRFVLKTVFRHEAPALVLGGFAIVGILIASGTIFSAFERGRNLEVVPSSKLLSIPLVLNYCLLLGTRMVFDIPAKLSANWTFR